MARTMASSFTNSLPGAFSTTLLLLFAPPCVLRIAYCLTDTHGDLTETVQEKMTQLDNAIKSFEEEMKAEGIWDKAAVLTASDFGRTLRSNGAGTDHAWGGNYFMVGGGLKPKRIHGYYPKDLSEESDVNVRTGGRLLPTTSWDAVWYGLAQWFGIPEDKMSHILPNIGNWDKAAHFIPKTQFFNN